MACKVTILSSGLATVCTKKLQWVFMHRFTEGPTMLWYYRTTQIHVHTTPLINAVVKQDLWLFGSVGF